MKTDSATFQRRVRRLSRLAIISLYLFALTWSIHPFFITFFIGLTTYLAFLALYYQSKINAQKSPRAPAPPPGRGHRAMKTIIIMFLSITVVTVAIRVIILFSEGTEAEEPALVESDALTDYRQQWINNPKDIGITLQLGNEFFALQQFDSALKYYNVALAVDPGSRDAQYNKGLTYYNLGEYAKSIGQLKKCVRNNPDYGEASQLIGDGYYSQQKQDSALYWYDRAYNSGLRSADLSHLIAYLRDVEGSTATAVKFYKEALSMDSTRVDIYSRLGELEPERSDWYQERMKHWKSIAP